MRTALLAAILLLVLGTTRLPAQAGGDTWVSWLEMDLAYGYDATIVASAGDVDGDGRDDFLVARAGRFVRLHSASGSVLREWTPSSQGFGNAVCGLGDVDGDGVPDLAVGEPTFPVPGAGTGGAVHLYSGADGSLLRTIRGDRQDGYLGFSLADAGDVDGDGVDDLLAGAPAAWDGSGYGPGAALLFSGATGRLLLQVELDPFPWEFGYAVAGLGDVDGDAVPDFAVGAPGLDLWDRYDSGACFVYSGRTSALLYRVDGRASYERLGEAVAGAGDVDGDGRGDLLVAAPGFWSYQEHYVELHSPARGAGRERYSTLWDGFAAAIAGGADLDGDAVPDFAIGHTRWQNSNWDLTGAVFVYSGASRELMWTWEGSEDGAKLGGSLAFGDVSGDGYPDVLAVRAGHYDRLVAFGLEPFLTPRESTLSRSQGGVVPFTLDFGPGAAYGAYQFLASAHGRGSTTWQGLEVPLVADALFAATAAGRYPTWALGFAGILDDRGEAGAAIFLAPGQLPAVLVGRTIHLAAVTGPIGGPPERSSMPAAVLVEP